VLRNMSLAYSKAYSIAVSSALRSEHVKASMIAYCLIVLVVI
jgi:hypothetical protein